MRADRVITFLMLFALLATSGNAADKATLKAAAKQTNKAFADVSFVAKMDLRRYVDHYVLQDGSPAPQKKKKQGKDPKKSTIQLDDGVKVHQGETGHSLAVYVKKDKIVVGLNKKPGAKLNPTLVHILFERELTAEDLAPARIARALTSVVEIAGYEPGADVAAAFDDTLQSAEVAAPVAPAPASPQKPTVNRLDVSTGVGQIHAGESVELRLVYEIEAPSGTVAVTETRTLTIGGELIPSYPVRDDLSRAPGRYTSNYRQPLPGSAARGVYEFKGEVCAGGDCISRTTTFEVVD